MTITLPTWAVWLLGTIVVLIVASIAGKSRGDYDFVSGLLGFGVIAGWVLFALGYWIAS